MYEEFKKCVNVTKKIILKKNTAKKEFFYNNF